MRGAVWSLVIVFGCGSPDTTTEEMCEPNGTCPPGFECRLSDRRCIRVTAQPPDAAAPAPDAASACPPAGGPTVHNTVSGNETWTAAARPHLASADLSITGTLTLEPCVEVRLGPGRTLTVFQDGALIAEGTAERPISIVADEPGRPWGRIRTFGGPLRFAHATIEGGGDPQSAAPELTGMLFLQGRDAAGPTQETLFVDHVTLRGSASNGALLRDGAGFFAGSTALTVTGSAAFPLSVWARAVGTVPEGGYTGNAADEINLPADQGTITDGATMRDRGVPYRIGNVSTSGDLLIARRPGEPGVSTLTIEPGVVLRFKPGGRLRVAAGTGDTPANGALVAAGTAARPIVFTSSAAAPAAGDWLGIWFGLLPDPANRIDHAVIEYAGGLSSTGSSACVPSTGTEMDAAIRIFNRPASQFVTNTAIRDSARHGIDRSWVADERIDFLPTNTFERIGYCFQTWPRLTGMACPATADVPCPR
jgi:hypothetical protein